MWSSDFLNSCNRCKRRYKTRPHHTLYEEFLADILTAASCFVFGISQFGVSNPHQHSYMKGFHSCSDAEHCASYNTSVIALLSEFVYLVPKLLLNRHGQDQGLLERWYVLL